MNCPKCGNNDMDCIEVDIGVGTMTGNYSCPKCGWRESDEEMLREQEMINK